MPSKKLAASMIGLLVVQYVLGMLANMYVKIPEDDPGKVFRTLNWVSIHSYVALLLLILAGVFVYQAHKAKMFLMPAIGGLTNILLAAVFGHIFVGTGNDIFSLLMSIAFIGALMSYARVVFTMRARESK